MNFHQVDFYKYCPMCKHKNLKEWKDPCNVCLANPVNEDSYKPVYFEEGELSISETKKSQKTKA